ncbi:MAG: hypothetical protein HW396_412 [Candidatus Dadabacteria bacterium]|nr:hypothetical protein [Candidatus Dadabacteria bacterium]
MGGQKEFMGDSIETEYQLTANLIIPLITTFVIDLRSFLRRKYQQKRLVETITHIGSICAFTFVPDGMCVISPGTLIRQFEMAKDFRI